MERKQSFRITLYLRRTRLTKTGLAPTLWYKSLSDKPAELKFVVEDNLGQHREMTISLDVETSSESLI